LTWLALVIRKLPGPPPLEGVSTEAMVGMQPTVLDLAVQ
jgi:hypothetical protein